MKVCLRFGGAVNYHLLKIPSVDFLSVVECFEQSVDHFANGLLHFATAKNLQHDFLDQLEVK